MSDNRTLLTDMAAGLFADLAGKPFDVAWPQVAEAGFATLLVPEDAGGFGGDWGDLSDADALTTLRAARDNGVTFFDTADVYGGGRSERVIGSFLKETQQDVFVATKLGRRSDPGWPGNFELSTMRAHTEDSLRNLGVESLVLTQLHCIPTEALRQGDVFDHLRTLQAEGKIQRWGVSVESVEEGLLCLEQTGITSLQIIFNLFRQKPIAELLPAAKAKGVGLIVRLPLASGLLTGKFRAETQFAPQDHRTYNRDGQAFNVGETFAGLPFETGVELADDLKSFVPDGISLTEMALRWSLDFEAISVLIPGAKDPAQALANTRVATLAPLSKELHQRLHDFYEAKVAHHIRGPY
jgi:aryl-alcohol dehydrogenase-like predicted oxidoreductase